jgi:tripartite-type tricarboxylate transporter receptor subunit TctC
MHISVEPRMRRRTILLSSAAAMLLPATHRLSAQEPDPNAPYPARPVRIIAPVQPGGGLDMVARVMAERLHKALGTVFIVENQSGAGGSIAAQTVARATPDGYTLMLGYVATHGTSPAVRKLPYDAIKDFTAIGMIGGTPNVFVIHPSLQVKTLGAFITYAKKNPGRLSYGSAGAGSLTHLAMEQFKQAADFFSLHIPYRGIAPAFTDLIAGHTHHMFPGLAAALPHIRAGKVIPLAVTGRSRHRLLPDTPTMQELGFSGFDGVQWYGIVGPAGMPKPIVEMLNNEINRQTALPEVNERLSAEAIEPIRLTPAQFTQFIRDDIARWTKLANERKIQID